MKHTASESIKVDFPMLSSNFNYTLTSTLFDSKIHHRGLYFVQLVNPRWHFDCCHVSDLLQTLEDHAFPLHLGLSISAMHY